MQCVITNRSKSIDQSIIRNDGIVMVPCGPKHLRARNWPIKADLYVMKMKANSH